MYYTALNPFTLEPVYVPRGHEKKIQRALMQFRNLQNRDLVIEGLKAAGRTDLIGAGRQCLIQSNKGSDVRYARKHSKSKQ
jgi:hypothetical protein